MKKRQKRMGMVERAVITERWRQNVATSRIHALIGDDSEQFVDQSGRVLYVTLAAAKTSGMSRDQVDVRIMRGAVQALHDQSGENAIDPVRRKSIEVGLDAAVRVLAKVPHAKVVLAACALELLLSIKPWVDLSDFNTMIEGFDSDKKESAK